MTNFAAHIKNEKKKEGILQKMGSNNRFTFLGQNLEISFPTLIFLDVKGDQFRGIGF